LYPLTLCFALAIERIIERLPTETHWGLEVESLGCNASKIIRFDLMFVWYESVLGRRCHNMAFKKVHAAEAGGWAHDQFSVCLTANMVTSDKHIYLRMTQKPASW